jgi:hypothetical protein
MADGPGHRALAHLDQALAKRPQKDDDALSAATVCLTTMRDAYVRTHRDGASTPQSRELLEHVNGIISAVLGIHFPLGEIPWPELDKAREWLACVVAKEEG